VIFVDPLLSGPAHAFPPPVSQAQLASASARLRRSEESVANLSLANDRYARVCKREGEREREGVAADLAGSREASKELRGFEGDDGPIAGRQNTGGGGAHSTGGGTEHYTKGGGALNTRGGGAYSTGGGTGHHTQGGGALNTGGGGAHNTGGGIRSASGVALQGAWGATAGNGSHETQTDALLLRWEVTY